MSHRILVIDDDKVLNQLIVTQLSRIGYIASSVHSWQEAKVFLKIHEPELILLDCRLPDMDGNSLVPKLAPDYPVVVITGYASVPKAVKTMQAGAAEYLVKPVNMQELEMVVKRTLEAAEMRKDFQFLKSQLSQNKSSMIGDSPAFQEVMKMIQMVGPSPMTVLIQGESGVGKELVAREIHEHSERSHRHFVALDCCTIQENLFESELFGHERGAFTGADRQKKGLIETAEDGTLFLDEIGEINAAVQAKLLRVLETGKFRRVGGTKDLDSNVRIVAATNRDLAQMSQEKKFRLDLYYRLNAFTIYVPPLRERHEDIPTLIAHFIENHDFSRRVNKYPTDTAMQKLKAYHWPGNIRELKNMVERAIILSGDVEQIESEHFTLQSSNGIQPSSLDSDEVILQFKQEPTLEQLEQYYLELLLKRVDGHRAKVAQIMGISERNVYRLVKKYDLGRKRQF